MFKEKYRTIIPNETSRLKNENQRIYCESYDIKGFDNKVKFEVKLLRSQKSRYDVQGNYLYQIKNYSHYDIESELDFCDSLHYRTIEKNDKEFNTTLFKSHIKPYQDILIDKNSKNKKKQEEGAICKVRYNWGYNINTRLKLAFTFPALKKQRHFIFPDHKEIKDNLEIWKKIKPCIIEQMLLFGAPVIIKKRRKSFLDIIQRSEKTNDNDLKKVKTFELLEYFAKKNCLEEQLQKSSSRDSKVINKDIVSSNSSENFKEKKNNFLAFLRQEEIPENKDFFFVDESFPPCQIDYRVFDLSKQILLNPKLNSNAEIDPDDNTKRYIAFHYRAIESINPDQKQIFNKDYVNPYDIKSGLVKIYNIISVFSHLAAYPKLLEKLFDDNLINDIGIYKIKIFYQNNWTPVYIDKFIPCFPMDFPIYTYSNTSLWPCILEKALAKIYRGYDNLSKISYFDLYQILTGFPIYNFKRIIKDKDNNYLSIKYKDSLYEKFKNKDFYGDLYGITTTYKYLLNSNLNHNKGSEVVGKDDVIFCYIKNNIGEKLDLNINIDNSKKSYMRSQDKTKDSNSDNVSNNNSNIIGNYNNTYLLGFYASDTYLQFLTEYHNFPINNQTSKLIEKKLFAVDKANKNHVSIKSLYNYQLKQFLNTFFKDNSTDDKNSNKESDTITLSWDIALTIFDNIIIIQNNNYEELHFRNSFIRCQDIDNYDFERILAHSYYELKIEKSKKVPLKNRQLSEQINETKIHSIALFSEKNTESRHAFLKIGKSGHLSTKKMEKIKEQKKSMIKYKSLNSVAESQKYITEGTDFIKVTIVLSLSNDHYLDNRFYCKEMDMKIAVIQLTEESGEKVSNENNNNNVNNNINNYANIAKNFQQSNNAESNQNSKKIFHGKNPVTIVCPEFQIGYSMIYDMYLEEGIYIVVPMTMGYCMQKNPKISSKNYILSKDKHTKLPLQKTAVSKFLDDLFYLNDPLNKNYLQYNIVGEICKNILDSKNKPLKIDLKLLKETYSQLGDKELSKELNNEILGLSKLCFKDYIFYLLQNLNENQIRQSMSNLGYDENKFPYISRNMGVSFYFEKKKFFDPNLITVTPKNNLIEDNMDNFINLRILENNLDQGKGIEISKPIRIFYTNDTDGKTVRFNTGKPNDKIVSIDNWWYTIEGVHMKKLSGGKINNENKTKYTFDDEGYYKDQNVFYSTHRNDVRVELRPNSLFFLLYVVEDILIDKCKKDYNEKEEDEGGECDCDVEDLVNNDNNVLTYDSSKENENESEKMDNKWVDNDDKINEEISNYSSSKNV